MAIQNEQDQRREEPPGHIHKHEVWVPCTQGSQAGSAPSWNIPGSSPCSVEFLWLEMGCQLALSTARVSPVLSRLLGRFIFLICCILCIVWLIIAPLQGGLEFPEQGWLCPPAGCAPSIIMTQHLAAPRAFQRRFIKNYTVHASTINPGRSCRACRASHTSLRAGAALPAPQRRALIAGDALSCSPCPSAARRQEQAQQNSLYGHVSPSAEPEALPEAAFPLSSPAGGGRVSAGEGAAAGRAVMKCS